MAAKKATAATTKRTRRGTVAESPTPKTRRKKGEVAEVVAFDPYAHLEASIDTMEKRFALTSMSVSEGEGRFSTGLLQVDLQLAGGLLAGGWYTFFGGEQSCKTTLATCVLGSIVTNSEFKGRGAFFDYEGSFQADYAENMWKYQNKGKSKISADSVFGVKDEEGNWAIKPKVRYYAPNVGNDFFHWLAKLEKILPDVIQIKGKFFYIYENNKVNQKALKGLYDTKYFKKYNSFKVPALDGSPQAIVLVDSYPAMLPEAGDEKEEGDKSLAAQARMFSDGIKRVKGAMRRKRIIVLGINQLRDIPMAKYGPTEQEPCGKALKFFSDARLKQTSISIPHGKGQLEEEDALDGGTDVYRYIKTKSHKNKLGGPQAHESIQRIVVSNSNGEGLGFCRVWDCFKYMQTTGQIAGSGMQKKVKFTGGPLEGKTVSWMEFKALIDGDNDLIKKGCKKLGVKPFRLYEWCRKQVASGKGYQLMMQTMKAKITEKRSKASSVSDELDDE